MMPTAELWTKRRSKGTTASPPSPLNAPAAPIERRAAMSIDYRNNAQERVKLALDHTNPIEAQIIAQIAMAEAILALVEQQRIANLVALAALAGNTHIQESDFDEGATVASEGLHGLIEYVPTPATPFGGPDEYPTIRPEIKEALGLS